MKKALDNKNKTLLLIAAAVMVLAWILLTTKGLIKKGDNPVPKVTEETEVLPTNVMKDYLTQLIKSNTEEIAKELELNSISEDTIFTDFEITNLTYNDEKAKVETQIYLIHSYLNATFYLEKTYTSEGATNKNNNSAWKIYKKEIADKPRYDQSGVTLEHGFDWKINTQSRITDVLSEWGLENEQKGIELIFMIEEEPKEFSESLIDCDIEQFINCSQIVIGDRTFNSSEFRDHPIEVLVLEHDHRNLIIMIYEEEPHEKNKEEIFQIINSIEFRS